MLEGEIKQSYNKGYELGYEMGIKKGLDSEGALVDKLERGRKVKNYWLGLIATLLVAFIITTVLGALYIRDLQKNEKDYAKLKMDYDMLQMSVTSETPETPVIEKTVEVPEDIIVKDTELMEFVIDYLKAQTTYIDSLTYILDQNNITYPVFYYKQLEEIIEGNEVKGEVE